MPARSRRLIILTAFILFFLLFLLPSTSEEKNDNNGITINTQNPDLIRAIVVGDGGVPITNPRTVSWPRLLENNEDYQTALRAKKENKLAQFSIYEAQATKHTIKLIRAYAHKNDLYFIFKEEPFFQFLSTIPDFEDKTEAELRQQFDITDDIIEYEKSNQSEKEIYKPKRERLKKLFEYVLIRQKTTLN